MTTTKQTESRKQIAERITQEVALICGCEWESCTSVRTATANAIEAALKERDERAVRIVESLAEEIHYENAGANDIIAAIRKDSDARI